MNIYLNNRPLLLLLLLKHAYGDIYRCICIYIPAVYIFRCMYVCMFVILIVYFCFLFLSCFSTPTPLSILAQLDETKNTRERELYVYSFYFLSFKKANFSSHPFTSPSKEINYWFLINLSYHACV